MKKPRLSATSECARVHKAVIPVTYRGDLFCQTRASMAKKAIAALLLIVVAAWAEMVMAPMLAMRVHHMDARQEITANKPARQAGDHHAEHVRMAGHSCCPGIHGAEPEAAIQLTAGAPPCADPHSCCFQQGPQSVPVPARVNLAREMTPVVKTTVSSRVEEEASYTIDNDFSALRPPPDIFGMTLRI